MYQQTRMRRGYKISQSSNIKQISEDTWIIPSQTGNGLYEVTKLGQTYVCTCKDFAYRTDKVGNCKHCFALEYYLKLQVQVPQDVRDNYSPKEITLCPDCRSPTVINYGKRGKRVLKQILLCKDCGRQFRQQEDAYVRLQSEPRAISLILSMHCRNVSLRGICSTLIETYGIKVSQQTIHNYLKRYEKLLSDYMNSLRPVVSGDVNIDELYVKIDGKMKYLFAALDPNTRYLLCTVLSQKKDIKGAKQLFRQLTDITGHSKINQSIKTITSDALPAYQTAFNEHFITNPRTNTKNPPKHIFGAGIRAEVDNNIMERMNGTIRSREKNYRGLKIDETPMLPLFSAYYNLIREHQAIGKTPAKAAGIDLKLGHDKWKGVIKKAQEYKRTGGKERVWEL
jgi:transposase-like protein